MAATVACVIASGYLPLIQRSNVSTSLTVKQDPVNISTRRYAAPTERVSFTTTREYKPSDIEGNETDVKVGVKSFESEGEGSNTVSSGPFMEDVKVVSGRRRLNYFFELAKELARSDGGPPRWFSPLECCSRLDDSPLLLFLPGIDGTGAGLVLQYPKLAKYDYSSDWVPRVNNAGLISFLICNLCLVVIRGRSIVFPRWIELVKFVEITIKSESSRAPKRPIYVVGESLGACLALAVAARNPNIELVLILANPALSFDRSPIQPLIPLLGFMPEQLPLSHPYLLSLMTGEPSRMLNPSLENLFSPQQKVEELSDVLMMSSYLPVLTDILPKETLMWKIQMLKSASTYANSRIHAVKAQTLVLISGKDQLFSKQEEIARCQQTLPRCDIRKFDESGPFLFLEDGFDLVMTIKGCSIYRRGKSRDYVLDFLPPTYSEYKTLYERSKWVVDAMAPVMFSTLENGKIVKGLAGIPSEGPVLMVGYHTLLGLELVPIISNFLDERNILVRGIAHPMMFVKYREGMMPDLSFYDTFRVMGAVPVSGTNFFRLLSSKSHVLLYPGGMREALHRKGEEYKLFWPEQSEFVRMAARFGAKIIPFGAVGEDDFGKVVVDYDDLMKIPYFRNQIRELTSENVKLRTTATGEVANQDAHLPGILPKIPGRFYYYFGKPIETAGRGGALKNREEAHELYLEVKSEVEDCMAYLKKKREEDPYRSIFARLAYQATHGSTSEIPTFEP